MMHDAIHVKGERERVRRECSVCRRVWNAGECARVRGDARSERSVISETADGVAFLDGRWMEERGDVWDGSDGVGEWKGGEKGVSGRVVSVYRIQVEC